MLTPDEVLARSGTTSTGTPFRALRAEVERLQFTTLLGRAAGSFAQNVGDSLAAIHVSTDTTTVSTSATSTGASLSSWTTLLVPQFGQLRSAIATETKIAIVSASSTGKALCHFYRISHLYEDDEQACFLCSTQVQYNWP